MTFTLFLQAPAWWLQGGKAKCTRDKWSTNSFDFVGSHLISHSLGLCFGFVTHHRAGVGQFELQPYGCFCGKSYRVGWVSCPKNPNGERRKEGEGGAEESSAAEACTEVSRRDSIPHFSTVLTQAPVSSYRNSCCWKETNTNITPPSLGLSVDLEEPQLCFKQFLIFPPLLERFRDSEIKLFSSFHPSAVAEHAWNAVNPGGIQLQILASLGCNFFPCVTVNSVGGQKSISITILQRLIVLNKPLFFEAWFYRIFPLEYPWKLYQETPPWAMPNTCWSLSHVCFLLWAGLFHALLHFSFLFGTLHLFCSFSIQIKHSCYT